ncbi:MAG: hypothetical protein M3436_07145 [Pseudomonadota bacterium]|nr:hypothetical protein [Pseudomonadota bacterium]
MNNWAFAGIVVGTLVVTNLFGLLRRGSTTFRIYSADPKNHHPVAIAISLLATIVGGGMFLGVGQIGHEAGVVGFIIGAVYLVGMSLFGAFAAKIAKVMDETEADTMLEVIEKRFSRRMAIQFSVVCLVMYFFLLGGQFVALYSFAAHATASLGSRWISLDASRTV